MSERKTVKKSIKEVFGVLTLKTESEVSEFKRIVRARSVQLEQEQKRIADSTDIQMRRKKRRIAKTQASQKLFERQLDVQEQISTIKTKTPTQEEIIIQGRIVDDRCLGIREVDAKALQVSLRDSNLNEISGFSKKSPIDPTGYYSITLTKGDVQYLVEKKIRELYVAVEDNTGAVLRDFESKSITGISLERLGSKYTRNLTFSNVEMVRRVQEKRTKQAMERKDKADKAFEDGLTVRKAQIDAERRDLDDRWAKVQDAERDISAKERDLDEYRRQVERMEREVTEKPPEREPDGKLKDEADRVQPEREVTEKPPEKEPDEKPEDEPDEKEDKPRRFFRRKEPVDEVDRTPPEKEVKREEVGETITKPKEEVDEKPPEKKPPVKKPPPDKEVARAPPEDEVEPGEPRLFKVDEPSEKPKKKPTRKKPGKVVGRITPSEARAIPDVDDVPGIGEVGAKKLHDAGIKNIEDLQKASASKISEILGISEERAKEVLERAKAIMKKYKAR